MDTKPRPTRTPATTAACLFAVTLAVAMAGLAPAGDLIDLDRSVATGAAVKAPWSRASMDEATRQKLEAAFELAMARVSDRPECAALFSELGADGSDALTTSLYFPAPPTQRASTCRRAVAYTFVGAAPTFLCGDFTSLTDEHAALVLVHEALHHAGLTERPADPLGMSSVAINDMVRKACGFEIFMKGSRG